MRIGPSVLKNKKVMSRQDPRVVEKLESGQQAKPYLYSGPKIFVSYAWFRCSMSFKAFCICPLYDGSRK